MSLQLNNSQKKKRKKKACLESEREFPPLASGALGNAACAAQGLMLTNIITLGSKHFFANEYEDSGEGGWVGRGVLI